MPNLSDCCLNAHVSLKLSLLGKSRRAPSDHLTRHVTRRMECLGSEKAFGDTNTHQQYGPEERNAWPPNAHNAVQLGDRGGRDDCVDVLLLRCTAVCLAGTGHWISAKLELRAI